MTVNWKIAVVLITVGTFASVSLFGHIDFHIEAFQFKMFVEIFDHGLTEVVIPPVGKISARTHQTPLKIGIELKNIDMDQLRLLLHDPVNQAQVISRFQTEMMRVLRIFVLRLLFLAALGGAFGMLIIHAKASADYIRGAILGFLLMGILILGTYYTYDINRFMHPQFQGILKAAPWMVGLAEQALVKVEQLGKKLQVTAENLYELFERIDRLEPLGSVEGTVKVLHVSDIHNNPAAYDFVAQIARSFNVDIIIDTGDISDFGTPLEGKLVKRLEELGVPYIFVPGNHDSPGIVEALEMLDNVAVITGKVIEAAGLTIVGLPDPAAQTIAIVPPQPGAIEEAIKQLETLILESPRNPHLLITHNHRIARAFVGKVPVILHGHDHQMKVDEVNGSKVLDAGTTGAAGIRGLQTTNEIPYTVLLLHFQWIEEDWRLAAVDAIKVFNLKSGFRFERTVFQDGTETVDGSKERD